MTSAFGARDFESNSILNPPVIRQSKENGCFKTFIAKQMAPFCDDFYSLMSFRFFSTAFVLFLFPLFAGSCVSYLAHVGTGQVQLLIAREPIGQVLQKVDLDPALKKKLVLVQKVREFAAESLALEPGGSYSDYVELDREALAWNVSASRELALEAKTWWFPIVGTVPYLGYFEKERAVELAKELEKKGYDTKISTVAGYSSLGWFDDPLYSTQTAFSDLSLIRLVIHESAHRTVWFDDDVSFNESFATFVEKAGTRKFLIHYFGPDSDEQKEFEASLRLEEQVRNIFFQYATLLQDLYSSNTLSSDKKREQKKDILNQFKGKLLQIVHRFGKSVDTERKFNNADFLSVKRYNSGEAFFQSIYQAEEKSWRRFVLEIKKLEDRDVSERNRLLHNEVLDEK